MTERYVTRGGITIDRRVEDIPVPGAIEPLLDALDQRRGVVLASSYEYPGRYTRWDMGFVDPPLALTARDRTFRLEALNARGRVLLPALAGVLGPLHAVARMTAAEDVVAGTIVTPGGRFAEEDRSRQ